MTQQAPSADRPSTAVDAVTHSPADAPSPLEASDKAQSAVAQALPAVAQALPVEVGGREGPEPTRFGDWEMRGRCIDF